MPEFLRLSTPSEALKVLIDTLGDRIPATELVDTAQSLGRVLAVDVIAPHPLPEFQRSTVDGYAVRASDTFGVSEFFTRIFIHLWRSTNGSRTRIRDQTRNLRTYPYRWNAARGGEFGRHG